jgi:hypothetical protein
LHPGIVLRGGAITSGGSGWYSEERTFRASRLEGELHSLRGQSANVLPEDGIARQFTRLYVRDGIAIPTYDCIQVVQYGGAVWTLLRGGKNSYRTSVCEKEKKKDSAGRPHSGRAVAQTVVFSIEHWALKKSIHQYHTLTVSDAAQHTSI